MTICIKIVFQDNDVNKSKKRKNKAAKRKCKRERQKEAAKWERERAEILSRMFKREPII